MTNVDISQVVTHIYKLYRPLPDDFINRPTELVPGLYVLYFNHNALADIFTEVHNGKCKKKTPTCILKQTGKETWMFSLKKPNNFFLFTSYNFRTITMFFWIHLCFKQEHYSKFIFVLKYSPFICLPNTFILNRTHDFDLVG